MDGWIDGWMDGVREGWRDEEKRRGCEDKGKGEGEMRKDQRTGWKGRRDEGRMEERGIRREEPCSEHTRTNT